MPQVQPFLCRVKATLVASKRKLAHRTQKEGVSFKPSYPAFPDELSHPVVVEPQCGERRDRRACFDVLEVVLVQHESLQRREARQIRERSGIQICTRQIRVSAGRNRSAVVELCGARRSHKKCIACTRELSAQR